MKLCVFTDLHGSLNGLDSIGDTVAAADAVVERSFTTEVCLHNPTEPHSSVAYWEGDQLVVFDSTQGVFGCSAQQRDVVMTVGKDADFHRGTVLAMQEAAILPQLADGRPGGWSGLPVGPVGFGRLMPTSRR